MNPCKRRGCPHPVVALKLCRKHYDSDRRKPARTRTPNASDAAALKCIEAYLIVHGYAPTYRELAKCLKVASISSAHNRVNRLIAGGYLERDEGKSRAIRLAKGSPNAH